MYDEYFGRLVSMAILPWYKCIHKCHGWRWSKINFLASSISWILSQLSMFYMPITCVHHRHKLFNSNITLIVNHCQIFLILGWIQPLLEKSGISSCCLMSTETKTNNGVIPRMKSLGTSTFTITKAGILISRPYLCDFWSVFPPLGCAHDVCNSANDPEHL